MRNYALGLLLVLPSIAVAIHLKGIDIAGTKEVPRHPFPSAKNPAIGGGLFMASGSFSMPGIVKSGSLPAQNQPPFQGTSSFNGNFPSQIGNSGPNVGVNIGPFGTGKGGSDVSVTPSHIMGALNSVQKLSTFNGGLDLNPSTKFQSHPPQAKSASEISETFPNTGLVPKEMNSIFNANQSKNAMDLHSTKNVNNSNIFVRKLNTTTTIPLVHTVSTIRPISESSTTGPALYNPDITTVSMSQSFGFPADLQPFVGTGQLPFAGPPPGLMGQEPREPSSGGENEFEHSAVMQNMHPQSLLNSIIQKPGVPPVRSSFSQSSQSNLASQVSGRLPLPKPASGTVVRNAALHSSISQGNALKPADKPSLLKSVNNLSLASEAPTMGNSRSRNPAETAISSAFQPSSGSKTDASMTSRQTTVGTTKQQLGSYQPLTVNKQIPVRTTTPAPLTATPVRCTTTTPRPAITPARRTRTTSRPATTTSHRATTTARRATTTSMSLWDFIFAPTTTDPLYAALVQNFMFKAPQTHHVGMSAPSDCDCNRKHDSCPFGKYPVGECHDGIICCDYW